MQHTKYNTEKVVTGRENNNKIIITKFKALVSNPLKCFYGKILTTIMSKIIDMRDEIHFLLKFMAHS